MPALEGHDLERLEVLALRSGTMLVTLLWLIVLLRLAYVPSQDMRHSGLWLVVTERHSPDAFLEHENGIPLTFDSYMRVPEIKGRDAGKADRLLRGNAPAHVGLV